MDFSAIDQAQQNANTQQQSATAWAAGGKTLADELRSAIGQRFQDSPIAKESGVAQANLLAQPAQTRAHIADLISAGQYLSPAQQSSIQATSGAAALAPVIGTNLLSQMQFGTLQDLINAGTNAWDKQATYQQGAATLARQNAQDLLSQLVTKSQLEQQAQMNPLDILLKKAQIANEQRLASGGGDSTSYQLAQLGDLAYLFNPKTGALKSTGIGTAKTKYTEDEIAQFANSVASGNITETQVPQAIRGQVDSVVGQIKSQKPFWQGGYQYNPLNFLFGR